MANIKNYKLLDITELSASTWSTAEKVLSLDENDKVVMAQPEENVNPEYVDAEIQEAIGAETARTEEVYAKKSELPDMEDYALASSVTQDIQTAIASETARTEDTYAKKSEIPDMDDYYTKDEVDQAIADVDVSDQLVEYAKTTAVTEAIQTAMAAETARTESTYLKEHQSLDNYYTKAQTDSEITAATQDMATRTWVGQQGYLTEHQSLAGLFDDARYVSSSKTINFYDKTDTLVATIDATDFIKDGMVDNVYISNGVLVISFNTDAGQEDIEIPLTDIFDPANYYDKTAIDGMFAAETARTESTYLKEHQSLDNYYTKAQVDAEITGATEGMATETWVQNQGYLTEHQDLSAYAKTTAVTQDIQTAIAAETGRTESTYAKKSEIPSLDGYWTSAQTQSAITAATDDMATETWVGEQGYLTEHQDISGKLDKTDFNTYTGATATAITATQEDINDHIADTNNPHQVTASQLGISASYDATNKTLILTIPAPPAPTPVADHFYIVDSEENEYEGIDDGMGVLTFDFTKTNTATWTLYNNNDVVTASTISLTKYINAEPTDDTIDTTDYPVENVDMGTGDASDDGLAEVIMYVNTSTNGITGVIYISHTEDPCEGYASQEECDWAQQGGVWESENLVCHMPDDCYDWEYWGYSSYEDCSCQQYGEGCEENEGE